MDNIKHSLIHMQPLLITVFFTEYLLLIFTVYWFILYCTWIGLFEPTPKVGKITANLIASIFIIINFCLLVLCYFHVEDRELFLFGAINYLLLTPLTLMQCYIPTRTQRLFGIVIVIIMSIVNVMILSVPSGFEWFIPVLYIKIFIGYNARENIIE